MQRTWKEFAIVSTVDCSVMSRMLRRGLSVQFEPAVNASGQVLRGITSRTKSLDLNVREDLDQLAKLLS